MFCNCRMPRFFKLAIVLTVMVFTFSGTVFAADSARIDPSGKVSVYRVGKKVDELSAEAPLPYDSLLVCVGQCRVRTNDLYFVAAEKSSFHINAPPQDNLILFLKGKFYFSLTELPRQLVFKTPVEDFTVQQVIFQTAASGGRLDGYIFVNGETAEIGVLEGGSLVLSSSHGEHVVRSGNQITLAKVDGQSEMKGVGTDDSDDNTRTILTWGLAGAAAIAGGVALLSGGGGDNPPTASPSSP